MGLYPFILLLVVLIADISNGFKMTKLKELEGLRFDEIGKLKLIKGYKPINFQINIRTLIQSIQNTTEYFSLVKDMFRNDTLTQNKLSNIKLVLDLKDMEFRDSLHGLVKTNRDSNLRKKRETFGLLDTKDGKKIAEDIARITNKSNEIIDISNRLNEVAHNSSTLLNKTIEETSRQKALMYLMDNRDDIERLINGLTKMLTERRLNSEIILIDELDRAIGNIPLKNDEALPYKRLIDFYYNLRLNYEIDEDLIKVELDVPIVEKDPRTLYQIVEIPARHQGKLIMTDVIWKYIAENNNETVVLMTLDVCYKSQYNETVYYCKNQSPIKNKNASDCLNNAISGQKTIDMNLCKYSAAEPTSLLFIKLNDGEYFYYTPVNETLTVICGAASTDKILVGKTSGIIELEPECIAVTSAYKLITTKRYETATYAISNIVRVFFDVDELKENIRKYNAPHVDSFYVESLGLLRDMSKPIKSIEKLEKAGFEMGDSIGYFMLIASLVIVVFVVYMVWKWRAHNRQKTQNTTKMPQEESVDYYVIKP